MIATQIALTCEWWYFVGRRISSNVATPLVFSMKLQRAVLRSCALTHSSLQSHRQKSFITRFILLPQLLIDSKSKTLNPKHLYIHGSLSTESIPPRVKKRILRKFVSVRFENRSTCQRGSQPPEQFSEHGLLVVYQAAQKIKQRLRGFAPAPIPMTGVMISDDQWGEKAQDSTLVAAFCWCREVRFCTWVRGSVKPFPIMIPDSCEANWWPPCPFGWCRM